jgi:hypothetical protein
MNVKNEKAGEGDKAGSTFDKPRLIITILAGLVAAGLVVAQFSYANDPSNQISLSNLDRRVQVLSTISDPVQRDEHCIPLSAYARQLDAILQPDARVFMTGMVGESNAPSLGYYYFLRNYLFPRDVEISLSNGYFGKTGYYAPACDSPDILKSNGFDLMIRYSNNQMQLVPLTAKGVPKAQ